MFVFKAILLVGTIVPLFSPYLKLETISNSGWDSRDTFVEYLPPDDDRGENAGVGSSCSRRDFSIKLSIFSWSNVEHKCRIISSYCSRFILEILKFKIQNGIRLEDALIVRQNNWANCWYYFLLLIIIFFLLSKAFDK